MLLALIVLSVFEQVIGVNLSAKNLFLRAGKFALTRFHNKKYSDSQAGKYDCHPDTQRAGNSVGKADKEACAER